jgi:hypothetical protein
MGRRRPALQRDRESDRAEEMGDVARAGEWLADLAPAGITTAADRGQLTRRRETPSH